MTDTNERLAKALGWELTKRTWQTRNLVGDIREVEEIHYKAPEGAQRPFGLLPSFDHSLDALIRDVVPVLRERGWDWHVGSGLYDERPDDFYAWCEVGLFFDGTYRMEERLGSTPAEALATAALEALESKDD